MNKLNCDVYTKNGHSMIMTNMKKTAFIKYEGKTNDGKRILELNTITDSKGRERHILNFTKVSKRIEYGTPFYICKCLDGKPYVFGRGITEQFTEHNIVHKDWIEKHPWMDRKNKYVFAKECEILDTELCNCPKTEDIFDTIGGDLFECKLGEECGLKEFQSMHNQRSHMFITENGYQELNKMFETAAKKYGTCKYNL